MYRCIYLYIFFKSDFSRGAAAPSAPLLPTAMTVDDAWQVQAQLLGFRAYYKGL